MTLVLQLLSGLLISLLVLFFSSPMLRFIGAEEKVFEYASDYLTLVGGFLFLQALYSSMNVIIRSHGLTKQPMVFATVMNILNTLLNLWLIPSMGVKGAALATVIGRAAGVVGMACFLFTKVVKPSISVCSCPSLAGSCGRYSSWAFPLPRKHSFTIFPSLSSLPWCCGTFRKMS